MRCADPRHDKLRIEQTKGGLLRDSYRWTLDNADSQQWRDEHRLLWIKGDPGKGKTMLLCGIIDGLTRSNADAGLSFFCWRLLLPACLGGLIQLYVLVLSTE